MKGYDGERCNTQNVMFLTIKTVTTISTKDEMATTAITETTMMTTMMMTTTTIGDNDCYQDVSRVHDDRLL